MSQQIRLEYPGSLWHIAVHGSEHREIFRDDADRLCFLNLLGVSVRRAEWMLCAYVLLPCEFRLLLKLTAKTLSSGMQWLSSTYAQRFNRRRNRVGHLVHGRFDGCLIDEKTYFLEVMRHIVLSPVRAGIVAKPDEYPWSSHLAVLGDASPPRWLAIDDLLGRFGNTPEIARRRYRAFIDTDDDRNPWDDLVGDIYLGSERWLRKVRKRLGEKPRTDERSRLQRTLCTSTMPDVIAAVADSWSIDEGRIRDGRGGVPRMVVAWIASNETLVRNRQIAADLRLRSAGRVTSLIRQCDRALDRNVRLRTFVERSVATLRRKM